ncbi:MAG: DUF5667 domain-containing protein [Patescibacteria group bacterium]
MNDEFHTHLKKAGDEVTLSPNERTRMRGVLNAYMEMKPVRPVSSLSYTRGWSGAWLFSPRPFATALVLALFVTSTGISYAAQGALPGDALYPVKVNVNEPVAGALAVTNSAKAEWAMSVAGKRLEEAATLAAEGRLSRTTQQELQTNFESHAVLAIRHIDEEASASADAGAQSAMQFEAQLSEYERVLSEVGGTDSDSNTFASAIRAQHDRVAGIRTRAEAKSATIASSGNTAAAVSRMRSAAKHRLDNSFNLARNVGSALASSSARVVARELEGASTSIADGDALLGQDSSPEALGAFQSALSASEKLGVFLQTSSAIHKRTGKVITEPKRDTKSPSELGREGRQGGGKSEKKSDSGNAFSASLQSGDSVQATASVQSETGDSGSREQGASGGSNTEIRAENGDEQEDNALITIPAPSSLFRD